MKNIDFLPQRYKDNAARRKAGLWRLLVVALLGGAVASASLAQFSYRSRVKAQLVQIQAELAESQATEKNLNQMRQQLAAATQEANLYAVIDAPWPKSQVLAAIVTPLDDALTLQQISVQHQQAAATGRAESELGFAPQAKQKQADSQPPAKQDMKTLYQQIYQRALTVQLSGRADGDTRLHAYLAHLESSALVERVELHEFAATPGDASPAGMKFTVEFAARRALGPSEPARPATGDNSIASRGQP